MIDQSFFVASMPFSRPADYYLGYMDGCVFLDFNNCGHGRVSMIRISFDGYGCCELGENSIPLNEDDSKIFKRIMSKDIDEQSALLTVVKKAIELNKRQIWADALEEYCLA